MDLLRHPCNLENCCRICLTASCSNMHDIFAELNNESAIKIADMLLSCTSIKVEMKDFLPKKICDSCYECLFRFYDFQKLALETEGKLRTRLCSGNNNLEFDQYKCSEAEKVEVKIEYDDFEAIGSNGVGENSTDFNQPDLVKNEYLYNEKCIIPFASCDQVEGLQENNSDIDNRSLECDVCHKRFKKLTKLEHHKLLHNSENVHKCNLCSKAYKHQSKLFKHLLTHDNDEAQAYISQLSQNETQSYECDKCSSVFKTPHSLIAHMKIHVSKGRVLSCSICDKVFKKISHLKRHEISHSNIIYNCTICKKAFITMRHLNEHVSTQHSRQQNEIKPLLSEIQETEVKEGYHQCDTCSCMFKSSQSLAAHMRKHVNKNRILSCAICSKVFKKISHLKRHELCHDDNRPYKCTECPKAFLTEYALKEHFNKHQGIKQHSCPVCPKSYYHATTLNNHLQKVHTRERAYLCPTCGKKFESSTNLNQHMRRHLGLKLFACSYCPQRFVSKGELNSHTVTHTGVRAHTCDQCGASFTKGSSLVLHKFRHSGIKPHQCDACNMKFATKDHLKRHYRIHTGEKPYHCNICGRAFTQSNDLVKHKRSHLGDKLYKCSQCPESFRLKAELRQHTSDHFLTSKAVSEKKTEDSSVQSNVGNKQEQIPIEGSDHKCETTNV